MNNYEMNRQIIKIAVENGIRYIQDCPKRGIHNLLDLGEYFASGRFQKYFFDLAHEMLSNENSSYYDLIENIVNNTNHDTITNFGINIGYNSFTYAAKIIRDNKKNFNFDTSWISILDYSEKDNFNVNDMPSLIKEGKGLGIYTYMIELKDNDIIRDLNTIFKNNDDCAFVVLVNPEIINEKSVKEISSATNLCILLSIDSSNFDNKKAKILLKYKCLFGNSYYYDDNNYINILNGWFSDKILSMGSNFGLAVKNQNCSRKTADIVNNYTYKSRYSNPSVFLMDLYGDIERIDKTIANKSW